MKSILFVFTIFVLVISSHAACPPKQKVVDCFFKKGDTDHNKAMTKKEVADMESKYISWWIRIPYSVFGGSAQIFKDCDTNRNKILEFDELSSSKTCLKSCDQREKVFNVLQC